MFARPILRETGTVGRVLAAICCLIVLGAGAGACAQDQGWKTGEAFARAARTRSLNGVWEGAELAAELTRTSQAAGLCVVLDRRIDPGLLVAIELRGATFEQLLWVAGETSAAVPCELESCFYLGPAETALALPARIRELRELAAGRELPATSRRALARRVTATSATETEPATFFRGMAEAEGLAITGWELVPFDLWRPIDWPAMPLGDCLTMALAGFDLQLAAGKDKTLEIVRCPPTAIFHRSLPGDQVDAALAKQLGSIKGLKAVRRNGAWQLEGDGAALVAAGKMFAAASGGPGQSQGQASSAVRLTLSTRARRRDLLAAITNQQGLELQFGDSDPAALDENVLVEASGVTVEELVALVLKGSGLKGELRGETLRISRQ